MNRFVGLVLLASAACAVAVAQPTYSADVAKIMQEKCQRCHRTGDIAPFSLATYDDALAWSEDIGRVVQDRIMPPWKPVPGHGKFQDDFGLTDSERQTILEWVAAGAPQGDPALAPPPLPEKGDWQLGDPDAIVSMPEPFVVPRTKDLYRCFVLPTNLDEDKWVDAVQILPGDRRMVHHVILFLDTSGQADKLDAADPEPGYTCFGGPGFDIAADNVVALLNLSASLGGWVPGSRAQRLPEGVGLFLPKNARIVMQVHYFPGGRSGPDQTKVGLYYSKKPVTRRLRYVPVVDTTFKIPPGESNKVVTASLTVPFFLNAHAVQVVPHMHLLGRKIKVEVERRDSGTEDLIQIDNWDFNWQNFYTFAEPVAIPGSSTVKLTCNFDNSENNPKNPSNPLKTVGWGEGTEDEMCIGFLGVTLDAENLLPLTARQVR